MSSKAEGTVKALSEDLGTEEMANGVDYITNDSITKDENPQTMSGLQNHKLDQPSKLGDASFGAGQSTVEQIFNCKVVHAKHIEHQRNLYLNCIDFKNAFGRVCHYGLRKVLIVGQIDGGFVQVTRALCDHPSRELF